MPACLRRGGALDHVDEDLDVGGVGKDAVVDDRVCERVNGVDGDGAMAEEFWRELIMPGRALKAFSLTAIRPEAMKEVRRVR